MAELPTRPWGGPAVLAAAAALGLAACGAGASSQIASLTKNGSQAGTNVPGTQATANNPPQSRSHDPASSKTGQVAGSTDGSTSTTLPKGNPTQLLDEWAACMRAHGDPDQIDPTIDANKDINITMPPGIQGGYSGYSGEYGTGGPGIFCRSYLTAAQIALGGTPNAKPDPATLLKFSECMRANGIPDFPDPTGDTLSISMNAGGDLNPNNPAFKSAAKLCGKKSGARVFGGGGAPPGTIKLDGQGPPGGGPTPNSGAVAGG